METLEIVDLKERTRARNESLWIALDWGGLMAPLAGQQAALDSLSRGFVENYLAVTDEIWDIKSYQRDRSNELEQTALTQDRQIAEDKVSLGLAQLAIKIATDEYVLAVRVYDAKVKALLMSAREYAAEVEREQLAVERSRAELAVAQEGLHLTEINAKIYYEYIQRAQVEADLARAQLEVAQAQVRAVLADIEAGEAEVRVIETQVEEYILLADKATLQADIASIYAEILTKQLSTIKLDVGTKEIQAGFGYIKSRLTDMLAMLDIKKQIEAIKTDGIKAVDSEIALLLAAEEAHEDLRTTEMTNALAVHDYEVAAVGVNIASEKDLLAGVVTAKENMDDERLTVAKDEMDKHLWAQQLETTAHEHVFKHMTHLKTAILTAKDTIYKGN